ncbi:GspE/PulE family protein [Fretibacter rubidus]|uniref:GspE/PulE family protein n=1 Tax=Fretibacter rubidus TaxID=570162 RepID=UPI00352B88C4
MTTPTSPSRLASIGEVLRARGQITDADLTQAERLQNEAGGLLGQALLRIGAVSEEDLLSAQSAQLGLPIMSAGAVSITPDDYSRAMTALGLTARWLSSRGAAVWQEADSDTVHLVAQNILNPELREVIEGRAYRAGLALRDYVSSNQTVEKAVFHIRDEGPSGDGNTDDDTARLREMAEEAPVIDFVNRVFSTALRENASDIHIEPFEHKFQVRYRIDGVLHTKQSDPKSQFDAVASRIKLLSGMDIAERRLPQDGRQSIRFAGQDIDLRVSALPGTWGESLVMRLLKKETELPDLEAIGLDGHAKAVLQDLLSQPNGIILVTGPTGSGKSTTLYRGLRGLNDGVRKIITIEDPVEYDMDGIIQIQTNAAIGYSFAKGLRAILRQDPDIIMVGEIRDGETATIAAQAALTGHLVLSTLHTNSALAAVARLIDIGLEPYMVISAVRGLVAQRLVRRLCDNCAVDVKKPDGEDMIWSMVKSGAIIDPTKLSGKARWRESKGCEKCSHTGYLGRVAIFETVKIDDALSEDILKGASLPKLLSNARAQGFITLLEDGILKARSGVTSLTEVFRVCGASTLDLNQGDTDA